MQWDRTEVRPLCAWNRCSACGRLRLEDQLQSELNVAWTSRPEHWVGTRCIRCVQHIAETCAGTRLRGIEVIRGAGATGTAEWIDEVRMIEEVKHLGAELCAQALCDLDVFADGR